jgi:hypothetical protein
MPIGQPTPDDSAAVLAGIAGVMRWAVTELAEDDPWQAYLATSAAWLERVAAERRRLANLHARVYAFPARRD